MLEIRDEDDDRQHPLTGATVTVVDTETTDFAGIELLTDGCTLPDTVSCEYSSGSEYTILLIPFSCVLYELDCKGLPLLCAHGSGLMKKHFVAKHMSWCFVGYCV